MDKVKRATRTKLAALALLTTFGASANDIVMDFNSNNGYNFQSKNGKSVPSWSPSNVKTAFKAPQGWASYNKFLKTGVKKATQGDFIVAPVSLFNWTNYGYSSACLTASYCEDRDVNVVPSMDADGVYGGALITNVNEDRRADWHDVDGGEANIQSPVFAITGEAKASVQYFLGFKNGNDNKDNYAYIQYTKNAGVTWNTWFNWEDKNEDVAPNWKSLPEISLSSGDKFQIRIGAADPTPDSYSQQDLVEFGIDNFKITYLTDKDNDGLPDNQEHKHCTSPSVADTDGDGTNDGEEVKNGTNPILNESTGKWADSDNDGFPNVLECAAQFNKDADNDGQPNYLDTDSDNDGLSDKVESLTSTPINDVDNDGIDVFIDLANGSDADKTQVFKHINKARILDTDGDGVPNFLDSDSDGDGVKDGAGTEGTADKDGDGIPNYLDKDSNTTGKSGGDSDKDGIPDVIEGKNFPLNKDSDNDGTPDYMETDSDNDGISDKIEAAVSGQDRDKDGIDNTFDADEIGKTTKGVDANKDGLNDHAPLDSDGDGKPNYQDTDSDNDGKSDKVEAQNNGNYAVDTDSDGIPDFVDADDSDTTRTDGGDSDKDGISDKAECKSTPYTLCEDVNKDGVPDYMQKSVKPAPSFADADGDGVPDNVEDLNKDGDNNPATNPTDTDGDGTPDYQDTDSDNDGKLDKDEVDNSTSPAKDKDTDGDTIPDRLDADDSKTDGTGGDSDGDGKSDKDECSAGHPNCADSDGDGVPDYLDKDDKASGSTGGTGALNPQTPNDSAVGVRTAVNGAGSMGGLSLLALGLLGLRKRK